MAEALGLWSFISGGIVRGARERLNTESGNEKHERRVNIREETMNKRQVDGWWMERTNTGGWGGAPG